MHPRRPVTQAVLDHPAHHRLIGIQRVANQSMVRRMIQDSLRYWARGCMWTDSDSISPRSCRAMRKAACCRTRPFSGTSNRIRCWPALSSLPRPGDALDCIRWDAIGDRWQAANGRFRDDIRRFLKGDTRLACVAARILQQPEYLRLSREREAEQSINFVTCHDEFTLHQSRSDTRNTTRRMGRITVTAQTTI